MFSIADLLEACLQLTPQQLEDYAWDHFKLVRDYLENTYDTQKTHEIMYEHLATICAIDDKFTDAEFELMRACFGFAYAEYKDVEKKVKRKNSPSAIKKTQQFCMELPYDERLSFVCVAIAILASDRRYTPTELNLLRNLLE